MPTFRGPGSSLSGDSGDGVLELEKGTSGIYGPDGNVRQNRLGHLKGKSMRKVLTLPIVAGMAVNPFSGPLVGLSLGAPVVAFGGAMALGGCARGIQAPDLSAIDIGATVTQLVRDGCGVLPVAETISAILVALALPAATPIQQQAALVARAICTQVNEARSARRSPLRSIAPDGKPAVSYGPVVINGHVVDVKAYQ
jgi:hypothetical protein